MPYIVVKGTNLPPGTQGPWTKTAISADCTGGDGWVIEAPTVQELASWAGLNAVGLVVILSAAPYSPDDTPRTVRGKDVADIKAKNAAATGGGRALGLLNQLADAVTAAAL